MQQPNRRAVGLFGGPPGGDGGCGQADVSIINVPAKEALSPEETQPPAHMHRSLGTTPLEFPSPFSRRSPLTDQGDDLTLDDDFFCLSVVGQDSPLSRAMPSPGLAMPSPSLVMPAPGPSQSFSNPNPGFSTVLEDSLETYLPRAASASQRVRRELPAFVPLRRDGLFDTKDPWGVQSVADLLRFFLLEITLATGLMAGCGLMAGRLLVRWTGTIPPMAVLGLYLGVLFLYIGSLYLSNRGGNSVRIKPAMRQLVFGLFLLLLPHAVAFTLAMH